MFNSDFQLSMMDIFLIFFGHGKDALHSQDRHQQQAYYTLCSTGIGFELKNPTSAYLRSSTTHGGKDGRTTPRLQAFE